MHRGTAMAFWDSAVFVRIVGHPDVERRSPAITRQGVTDGAPPVLSESVAPTAYPATHARAYSQRNATEELDFVGPDVQ